MKPTSSTQCSTVISLLQEGHSLLQIQSITGLGKSTIGRIKKEVAGDIERDRKSTRLNSSHQIISYAVFCLKKKTSRIVPLPSTSGCAYVYTMFLVRPL